MPDRTYVEIDGGNRRTADLIEQLAERMAGGAIPLWRFIYLMTTLHPVLLGSRYRWVRGRGVDVLAAPREVEVSDEFQASPIREVYARRRALWRHLVGDNVKLDFPLREDLRDQGGTDICVPAGWVFRWPHGHRFGRDRCSSRLQSRRPRPNVRTVPVVLSLR